MTNKDKCFRKGEWIRCRQGDEGIQEIPKEDMEPLAGYGNDVVVAVQSPEPSGNRGHGRQIGSCRVVDFFLQFSYSLTGGIPHE